MIHDLYKLAKVALEAHTLLDDVVYNGKEYLGEVFIQDSYDCLWKIKGRNFGC